MIDCEPVVEVRRDFVVLFSRKVEKQIQNPRILSAFLKIIHE